MYGGNGKHVLACPVRAGQQIHFVGFVPADGQPCESWLALRNNLAGSQCPFLPWQYVTVSVDCALLQRARRLTAMPSSNMESGAALTSKVPQITPSFWVLKLLTTGMGEAASDYLLGRLHAVGFGIGLIAFALALWVQFRTRAYTPFAYWPAVMMVAVFGTMAADTVHHQLGLPYMVSTLMGVGAVTLTFAVWRRVEGTLSIHSITTQRRE